MTPLKSIRAKCLDCCCGNMAEVNRCPAENCALHPYRFGRNPNIKRECTAAQLEALKNGRVPFQNVDNISGADEK